MLIHEEQIIKLRLFKIIVDNADKLCDPARHLTPQNVAAAVNDVYNKLFNKPKEE